MCDLFFFKSLSKGQLGDSRDVLAWTDLVVTHPITYLVKQIIKLIDLTRQVYLTQFIH